MKLEDLEDGSVLILADNSQSANSMEIQNHLSKYIKEKNSEIWVYLQEVTEMGKIIRDFEKVQMSYDFKEEEVINRIV